MDEQELIVWIDSPEEVKRMPDEVRKMLEKMDSEAQEHDVGMAA